MQTTKVNEEGNQQTTPDLDQVMTEGRASFTDDDVAPKNDPAIAGPAVVKEEDLLSGSPEDDINPPPSETAPEQEPPAQPDHPAQDPPRFKSHEEAEKGYRHLQREKTLADQRVLTLTEELQRQKKQEQEQREREAEQGAFEDFAQSRNEQALKEIDEIDPDDPEFRKKAAAAWARAHRDIRYYTGKPAPPAAAPPQPNIKATPESDAAQTSSYVQGKLIAAGLPGDDLLFWQIARDAPTTNEQGQAMSLDEQIQWALTVTKNYRDQLPGTQHGATQSAIEADRKAREAQVREMPLGRSAADRASAAKTSGAPVSMAEAINFAQEQRRL